jgi:hypothetical protein
LCAPPVDRASGSLERRRATGSVVTLDPSFRSSSARAQNLRDDIHHNLAATERRQWREAQLEIGVWAGALRAARW